MKNHIEKYLNLYAERGPWRLTANSFNGIRHAVVIPALAEYPTVFKTLHSLSLNCPAELNRTLVVCVVNNPAFPQATEDSIANNRMTLSILNSLLQKKNVEIVDNKLAFWIDGIMNSSIRLAYIDASSSGLELPDKGGVGLARKIGLDFCLPVLEYHESGRNLLFSLDADTLVEPTYLQEVSRHFSVRKRLAAVVPFAHEEVANRSIQEAIAYYESYLRYYVVGLKYANSPYAFHTIGSTIVSSAEGYAMVRGMPKRLAAEDFYFLNKLTKIQPIGLVEGTKVYPSPRFSSRTPFGTGKRIGQLIGGEGEVDLFYNPRVFTILGKWLNLVTRNLKQEGKQILADAEKIDPSLQAFVNQLNFVETWGKLKKNFPMNKNLLRQFHAWFDGFKTLKLIHYLTDHGHPKIATCTAVKQMISMIDINTMEDIPGDCASGSQILAYLRKLEEALSK